MYKFFLFFNYDFFGHSIGYFTAFLKAVCQSIWGNPLFGSPFLFFVSFYICYVYDQCNLVWIPSLFVGLTPYFFILILVLFFVRASFCYFYEYVDNGSKTISITYYSCSPRFSVGFPLPLLNFWYCRWMYKYIIRLCSPFLVSGRAGEAAHVPVTSRGSDQFFDALQRGVAQGCPRYATVQKCQCFYFHIGKNSALWVINYLEDSCTIDWELNCNYRQDETSWSHRVHSD